MFHEFYRRRTMRRFLFLQCVVLVINAGGFAQGRGGGRGGPPPTPQAGAPFDMTGYWVSIVTEDWRWRMFPNKGDYAGNIRQRQSSVTIDTGYWVSIVTEDWRWRMFPNKGDYAGVPLNAEGRKVADTWDPAKDEAAREQCKAYGAVGIMRIPGRFHTPWQDDQTLKFKTAAGKQPRLLPFGPAPPAA